jgi:hypothetical protein
MSELKERFTVKKIVKFGMLFGFRVYDTLKKEKTFYEYDEEEEYRAISKCELLNALNK